MISDFNVTVPAIDETMSAYDGYLAELSDIGARVMFETNSLFSAVSTALLECEGRIESIEGEIDRLYANEEYERDYERFRAEYDRLSCELSKLRKKHDALESLSHKCNGVWRSVCESFASESDSAKRLVSEALSFMGRYIHDINLVADEKNGVYGRAGVYVCVVDSSLHPESAEHIRTAIRRGQPSIVTIDRDGANARRTAALRNVGARSEFDRDEYPLAMFREGGEGADVFYLDPDDNRGSGSYIAGQLRALPNGSRVRIRVV